MFPFNSIYKRVVRKVKVRKTRKVRGALATRKYLENKEVTRKIVLEKLEIFKNIYLESRHDLSFNRVAIRDTKTRWGSCSSKKNLNFNYRLALIPSYLIDYIVVHELCHLKEMNHKKSFWDLIYLTCPNYPELKEELKLINLHKL
jgi:predicted metal-dependent hydrolase